MNLYCKSSVNENFNSRTVTQNKSRVPKPIFKQTLESERGCGGRRVTYLSSLCRIYFCFQLRSLSIYSQKLLYLFFLKRISKFLPIVLQNQNQNHFSNSHLIKKFCFKQQKFFLPIGRVFEVANSV